MTCRFCAAELRETFVDLGMSPLCQTHITDAQLSAMEPYYPLHAFVCETCFLVQLGEFVAPDAIFSEYAYFSSYSDSWLAHAKTYVEDVTERLGLGEASQVVEIASNDGYLLQYFVEKKIPVLGVEPAENVAQVATDKGIPTTVRFFGRETANALVSEGKQADLLLGNNVLAHVPDLNDFVAGMQILLKPDGVITVEFPHLIRLIEENQFDTIYHEHFSYFSFSAVERVFAAHGLTLFDVEELPTHGGSLRIYGRHEADTSKAVQETVGRLKSQEMDWGVFSLAPYRRFNDQVKATKRRILRFLIDAKDRGKSVVGYGAPGKGNTLLNYCGIRTDFLDYTVDRNPYKQGKYTPGTHIPILDPETIKETKPDYIFILPWNLRREIIRQNQFVKEWGGKFVTPIPEIQVYAADGQPE
jgi:2-polyprenyl-3-methyl-5-hydroxy-6-metoxy-1,4-benzoquinol methylase